MLRERSRCMQCNLPQARQVHWLIGIITMQTMITSAFCSIVATGRSHFCLISTSATAPILGTTVGVENTYGALDGRTPAMPLTYGRLSTDDTKGIIKAYIGEGELDGRPPQYIWQQSSCTDSKPTRTHEICMQKRF